MRVPEVQEIKASIQSGIAATKAGFAASPTSGKPTPPNPYDILADRSSLINLWNCHALGWVLFGYLLSSCLAVIIPTSKWIQERNKYYSYAGKLPPET